MDDDAGEPVRPPPPDGEVRLGWCCVFEPGQRGGGQVRGPCSFRSGKAGGQGPLLPDVWDPRHAIHATVHQDPPT